MTGHRTGLPAPLIRSGTSLRQPKGRPIRGHATRVSGGRARSQHRPCGRCCHPTPRDESQPDPDVYHAGGRAWRSRPLIFSAISMDPVQQSGRSHSVRTPQCVRQPAAAEAEEEGPGSSVARGVSRWLPAAPVWRGRAPAAATLSMRATREERCNGRRSRKRRRRGRRRAWRRRCRIAGIPRRCWTRCRARRASTCTDESDLHGAGRRRQRPCRVGDAAVPHVGRGAASAGWLAGRSGSGAGGDGEYGGVLEVGAAGAVRGGRGGLGCQCQTRQARTWAGSGQVCLITPPRALRALPAARRYRGCSTAGP